MISFRLMEDTKIDYELMYQWFLDEGVKEWVCLHEDPDEIVTLEKVIAKYRPRVIDPKDIFSYFILSDGKEIGFIQYYIIDTSTTGIDLWIGEGEYRNKGLGTQALNKMVEHIRENTTSNTIVIDPECSNMRAIKCYTHAGFVYDHDIEGTKNQLMVMHL